MSNTDSIAAFSYRSCKDPKTALRARMIELAQVQLPFGYRRLHVLLQREAGGWQEAGLPSNEWPDETPQVTTLTDAQVQAIVQSPRSLWDTTYQKNSWIPGALGSPIYFLPRLQAKSRRTAVDISSPHDANCRRLRQEQRFTKRV